jgi:glycosyltransferase involved in cell wall biosynthesis
MLKKIVGISILTNGNRRTALERCVVSILEHCYYRPLAIGITSNGSTDDTVDWIDRRCSSSVYGVEWRKLVFPEDRGCAAGTNSSIDLVSDCELQIHIESDFELLSESESGVDRMWLHRAVELLNSGDCDYLYLRRMRDEQEAAMHWWSQWMPKVTEEREEYLCCPGFWWSNNPVLFRIKAMREFNVLPLDLTLDGQKGTRGWSQPELQAPRPPKTWLHRWGVFVHERGQGERFDNVGCGDFGPYGRSGCKYGFWKDGSDVFCQYCEKAKGFEDMNAHFGRLNYGR